jgi:hypothetical protein
MTISCQAEFGLLHVLEGTCSRGGVSIKEQPDLVLKFVFVEPLE